MVTARLLVVCVSLAIVFASTVRASPSSEASDPGATARARELFFGALEKIRAERWAAAERDLQLSNELVPRPSTLYNLALVTFKQGRLLESLELATALTREEAADSDPKYRDYAQRLIDEILKSLVTIELTVSPPDADVSVDSKPLPGSGTRRTLTVDPGRRALSVDASGHVAQTIPLVLLASERRFLEVHLARQRHATAEDSGTSAPKEMPRRTVTASPVEDVGPESGRSRLAPWLLVGTGGALLAGSLVTGILAANADDDFVNQCPELRACDPGLRPLQSRVETLGTASDVLLVAGAATGFGGLAWLLLAGEGEPSARRAISPAAELGPESVELGVSGAF